MYENRKLGFMYVLPFVIGVALFNLPVRDVLPRCRSRSTT